MSEKNIRVGVDDSQLKNVGKTAQSLVDNMIRSSTQYSTSSKEVLRDIEDQIRAIEKRNKLDLEGKKAVIDAERRRISLLRDEMMYEARAISDPKKRASAIREVSASYSESKQSLLSQEGVFKEERQERIKQTQALRDIIDEIKVSSREEIKANRDGVEKTIRKDKTLDKRGVADLDAQEALKRTLQRDELGRLGKEESEESFNFKKYGRGGASAFNTAAGLATSKNDLYVAAGLVSLIPLVGQGLSSIVQRTLSAGETAEKSMTTYARTKFGDYSKSSAEWERSKSLGLTSLGLDPSEVLERRSSLMRSTGRNMSDSRFKQLMGAEQFVGGGNIDQLASINRYGGGNMTQVLQVLEGNQRNVTRLTENISAYVQASNNAIQIGSSMKESQMASTVMAVSRATGQQGVDLNQTMGAIQGLGNSGNPIVRSLMMRAYRQSNPNASLFDIQAMMEDPISSMKNGGGQFLSNIKEMTGGGEMYKQVLYSMFGGQLSRTRINKILKEGDFDKIASELSKGSGGNIDWLGEAEKTTGISTKLSAETDTAFQDWGKEMIKVGGETVDTLKALYKKLAENETVATMKPKSMAELLSAVVNPVDFTVKKLLQEYTKNNK